MILIGEKVSLRPMINEDFSHYYRWHLDNEIRFQTLMHSFPVSEENENNWFNGIIRNQSNKRFLFTITINDTNDPIGYFQLMDVNFINRNAMLGIVIGEKEWQGKGLGKEIMKLGVKYGFDYLGLQKISLDVLSNNKRAIQLYKKLGFTTEGKFIKQYFFNGNFYDVERMAIFLD